MSMIMTDTKTGKVTMASFSTIRKNGRTLLFPQMIDITDIKNTEEIYKLIMEFEANFEPEKESKEDKKKRKAAEKAWVKSFLANKFKS